MDGLRRLEYPGYDSAGIALLSDGKMEIRKRAGRISNLAQLIQQDAPRGNDRFGPYPLGHATEASPTLMRIPHLDQSGKLALIHNGCDREFPVAP